MSHPAPRPVMLCILDGWGLSDRTEANAVALGNTPNFDRIWNNCPHTQLSASGSDVGLQPGIMGNSEVGHLNIGAGRIVWQDSLVIDRAIDDESFFANPSLLGAMHHARDNDTNLHLMGLVSNGSVHASETHYFALLEMAANVGLRANQVLVHAFTDGRDTPPQSALEFIARLLRQMTVTGVGAVASVIGRYYAMDRDNRWQRTQEAYDCLTLGSGHNAPDALAAVRAAYERGENDEFIKATVVHDADGKPRPRIAENDAVIFFNYRSDRGRQLTHCFVEEGFDRHLREASQQPGAAAADNTPVVQRFKRTVWPHTHFVTMTRYAAELTCPIGFEPRPQRDGLGETAAKAGKTQLRAAETEKYPHVTYFFSGGIEEPWPGEERILVPSPKVATYDLQPEMSAGELTGKLVAAIESKKFDLIILNFANPDMVGHTGVLEAAIRAVETVDGGLGRILTAIEQVGGALLVIADHGNCEQMVDPKTGKPHTAHTTNPVPCILFGKGFETARLRSGGRLADVAPTLLDLMGLEKPRAMTGVSLLDSTGEKAPTAGAQAAQQDGMAAARQGVLDRLLMSLYFYTPAQSAAHSCDAALAERLATLQGKVAQEVQTLAGGNDATTTAGPASRINKALLPAEISGAAIQTEIDNQHNFQDAAEKTEQENVRDLLEQAATAAQERAAVLQAG